MTKTDWSAFANSVYTSIDSAGVADLAAIPALRHVRRSPTLPLAELIRVVGATPDLAQVQQRTADPNTPPADLVILAAIAPEAFCRNPVLPLLLLENPAFPATFDPAAAGRVLACAALPTDLVDAFITLGQPAAAAAARMHVAYAGALDAADWPAALTEAIMRLPTLPEDDLLAVLLALDAVPDWLLPRVQQSSAAHLHAARAAAAGDWHGLAALLMPPLQAHAPLPVDTLATLLTSEDPADRIRAAADPRLTAEQLRNAKAAEDVTDVEYSVYEALAANPAAPPDLLLDLARDRIALNTRTRRNVALHPNAPPAALALLADEPYAADIRLILAAHPNLGPAERDLLLRNSLDQALNTFEPFYQALALAHPSAEPTILADYAEAPDWLARLAVALNPTTPAALRATLVHDGNRFVRTAAQMQQY
jgi:hypothetical protein